LTRFKKILKQIATPFILRGRDIGWKTKLTHVLIEEVRNYQKENWLNSFNQIFPEWHKLIEIQFFDNFVVRDSLIQQTDIYIGTWFSEKLIKQSPHLKLIQLLSSGVEFLNLSIIPDNIQITTASGITSESVAEHVLMLMLALDRRLDLAIERQKVWHWDQDGILQNIRGLKGRVVGIIGLGNNGRAVAFLTQCIGMKVVGFDIRTNLIIKGVEICRGGLSEVLSISDFVVLCVPLTKKTKNMIGSTEFKKIKKNAYLINVARGEIVDDKALAWALRKDFIKGAALDVLSSEPPRFFHPLRGCPNLIITPHVAGNINVCQEDIRRRLTSNVRRYMNNEQLEGLLPNYDI